MSGRSKQRGIDAHELFPGIDKGRVHKIRLRQMDQTVVEDFVGSASRAHILQTCADRDVPPGEFNIEPLGREGTPISGPIRFVIPQRASSAGIRVDDGATAAPSSGPDETLKVAEKALDSRAESLSTREAELTAREAQLRARAAELEAKDSETRGNLFEVMAGTQSQRQRDHEEERRRTTEHFEARLRDKDAHHEKRVQDIEAREEAKRKALNEQHQTDIARLKADHDAAIARLEANHETETARLESRHESDLARAEMETDRQRELRQDADEKLTQAQAAHREAMADAERRHRQELKTTREAAEAREASLKESHGQALVNLRDNLEREHKFEKKQLALERSGDGNIPASIRKEWHLRRLDRELPAPDMFDTLDRNIHVVAPLMTFMSGFFKEDDPRGKKLEEAAGLAMQIALARHQEPGGSGATAAAATAQAVLPGATVATGDIDFDDLD